VLIEFFAVMLIGRILGDNTTSAPTAGISAGSLSFVTGIVWSIFARLVGERCLQALITLLTEIAR
jgi:hypothetical protein